MLIGGQAVKKNSMAPEPGEDYPDPITGRTNDEDPVFTNSSASSLANGLTEDSWLEYAQKMAQTDSAWREKLWNYYATKDSEKTAREWTAQREDSSYQRLMDDLQKAGISPYILSGASPMASASTGKSYSGSEVTSRANNKASNERQALYAQMASMGIVLSAIIRAIATVAVA